MTALVLDTLKITQKRKARGYSEEQAVGFVEAIQDINLDQLVTKADLVEAKSEMLKEVAEAKFEVLKWMFSGFLAVVVLLVGILMKMPGK